MNAVLLATLLFLPAPASSADGAKASAATGHVSLVGDLGVVGIGPVSAPLAPTLASQFPAPSILTPITGQPVGVQAIKNKNLSLPASLLPTQARVSLKAAKNDGKPAVTALQGLLRHGTESSLVPQIKGGAAAKNGAELNFMQSAALENPYSGGADIPVKAAGLTDDPSKFIAEKVYGGRRTVRLDSGMKIELISNPRNYSATVVVAYDVGGRDEPEGESGYTHFVEHLMFQGTTRIKNWFRMVGTMGTATNAATYRDHTIYTQTLPFNMLENALELEAERMLHLDVTPEKVEREKRIILEEKAGRDSAAYAKGLDKLNELLFLKKRNQSNVIGSKKDIQAATAEKLKRYLETYYTPDRAHVVVKGMLDLDKTEAWVRRYFGAIPKRQTDIAKNDLSETGLKREARAELIDGTAASPAVLLSWLAPKYRTADYYAAGVLTQLVTHRLQKKLILNEQRALGATLQFPYLDREPAAISGSIVLGPGLTPEAALAALDDEIARIARGEIEAIELSEIIVDWTGRFQRKLDEAEHIALASARGLNAADLEVDIQKWKGVTIADIQHAARAYFGKNQRAIVTLQPGGQPAAAAAAVQDEHGPRVDETPTDKEQALLRNLARAQWPELHFKAPVEFTLDNGLKVIVKPDNRVPTVYAKLAFRLGEMAVNSEMRAKVPLVANLLRLKTAEKDALTMNDSLQAMPASVQVDQPWDHVVFNGNVASDKTADLLSLMAEIVTRPSAWTDAELAPYKAWWKESIKASAADANFATNQRAVTDILGDHPSARSELTAEAIDALSAAEFVKLVSGHFAANNAVLVVAGDVDPEKLKQTITPLFGEWKPAVQTHAPGPANDIKAQQTISLLDRPGAEQSLIRLSAVAVDASAQGSADHFPMIVADAVLGGGLASRLTSVLRQSLGLAYNTFSNVLTDPTFAMLTLGVYTRAASTGQALDALLEQTRRLREEPIDEIELGAAKNALISSFIMALDSIGSIADNLLGLELFHQPLSSFSLYPQRVAAVTAAQVQQSAAKLLDPKRLAITVAGDASIIKQDLSKVRPVVEYTPEGPPKERPSF